MFKLTLRSRIYFSMLAVILISLLVTGFTAYFDFESQNAEYNEERLERKEHAVRKSMQYFLASKGGYIHPDSVSVYFSDKICELSDIHNLDILMFDLKGRLIISAVRRDTSGVRANSEIAYETEEEIDFSVYKKLVYGIERAETEEIFRGVPHILTYWYFKDYSGKPIAITGVRYNRKEVNREDLNKFLLQLTAIYIPLFIGASILAFIISNYITKSLQRIGERMKEVTIGEQNDPITWDSNDEIGALVKEYNRMLNELEKSAESLARSERESAWREMAKQVAHEIKNPLTPMKLRIQQLQRAWEDHAPNFEEKFKETSLILIEQIDTLTSIANEFSNFAQMPRAKRESCDLCEITSMTLGLFSEVKNAQISWHPVDKDTAPVFADRDQISRVLNNLITNAIQSIPEGKTGVIEVSLKATDTHFLCEVKDNGSGIIHEEKDKIFTPNFTTKSTGMGLGLAMVKNIIRNHGGEVWFETEFGKGSVFWFSIPKKHS